MGSSPTFRSLDADRIVETTELLSKRIQERFPGSGLGKVCEQLMMIARNAKERSAWIARPLRGLRIGVGILIALVLAGLAATCYSLAKPVPGLEFPQFIQTLEAGINDMVLLGVFIIFLVTLESRIKRRRALRAIRELRALAHIIDMHQLTKDPQVVSSNQSETPSSPRRKMSPFELSRYLDYCTEMLSLIGKISALYVQHFDDAVALAAVNEIETLTTELSNKIWQKLMILHMSQATG